MKTFAAAQKTPPWPATATALFALMAYAVSYHESSLSILVSVLAGVAALAAYLSPARLARKSWTAWFVRVFIFFLVVAAVIAGPEGFSGAPGAEYWHLFTLLCMVELGLQYWFWPPPAGTRGAVIILFSGLVFMAASLTFRDLLMPCFAPVYCVLVVLALRAMRPRSKATAFERVVLLGWPNLLWLGVALLLGFLLFAFIRAHRNELDRIDFLADYFRELSGKTIGFSENPILGASYNPPRSPLRVLRIEGEQCPMYLRVLAFDTYSEKAWHPLAGERLFEPAPLQALRPGAPGRRLPVTRLTWLGRKLPLPLHAAGVATQGQPVDWAPQAGVSLRAAGPLAVYEVIMNNDPQHQGPLCLPPDEAQLRRCLEVSAEIDPRVKDLAGRITGDLSTPLARVQAVEAYLRKNHAYSLTIDPGPGDPLSNFLLEKKAAHCNYFASAAVMLLRCLGLPARYVNGFYAHESAAVSATLIRQRDAHAWAECWLADTGWITVDATPPESRPDAALAALSPWTRFWERMQDRFTDLREWLAEWNYAQFLLALGALALVVLLFRRLRRRRGKKLPAPGFVYSPPPPSLAALASNFEARLRRRNLACPASRTWSEHLALLQAENALLNLRAAEDFVREYKRVRFGVPEDAAALARLRELDLGL